MSLLKDCIIESEMNVDSTKLPIGMYNPKEESIFWICAEDGDERITSTFYSEKDLERKIIQASFLPDMEEVYRHRDVLISEGWKFLKRPTMKINDNGNSRDMNRKERRHVQRKLERNAKKMSKLEGEK